jgi:hypothetical protein
MPAIPIPVIEARNGYLYDGTNSADLAAAIADFTVTAETPTMLSFTSGGVALTVLRNGYVVATQGMVSPDNVFANQDDFLDIYSDVSTHASHVHDIVLHTGPAKDADAPEYPVEA